MKNKLFGLIIFSFGVLMLSACSDGKEKESTGTISTTSESVNKTMSSTSSSSMTAQEILDNSKENLVKELQATPKKDENQKIDPKYVPNFVGMTTEEARTIKDSMTDATFVMSMTDQVYRSDLPEGTILAQSAKPGSEGGGRWITFIASTQDESLATPVDQASLE